MVPGARARSGLGQCSTRAGGQGHPGVRARPRPEGRVARAGNNWLSGLCEVSQGQCLGLVVGPAGGLSSLTLNPWPRLTFLAEVRNWPGPYPGGGCSCSRSPAPSRQRSFLSQDKISIACCFGSENSCEENCSLPGRACARACTRVLVCAHVCAGSQGAGSSGPSSPLPASCVWPGMFQSTSFVD